MTAAAVDGLSVAELTEADLALRRGAKTGNPVRSNHALRRE